MAASTSTQRSDEPPRLLVATVEYPPMGYGVSVLCARQVSELARCYREAMRSEDAAVAIRVVSPRYPEFEHLPVEAARGVEELRFRAVAQPIVRLPNLAWNLLRRALPFRPEVIYCPQYRAFGPIVWLLSRCLRRPYVAYFHGTEVLTELPSPLRRAILTRYARGAAVCFCNSAYTCGLVNELLGPRSAPARELNPPLDAEPFLDAGAHRAGLRERLGAGADGDRLVVLTVAQLTRRKAIDTVLDALIGMRARDPAIARRVDYWIVGDGAERADLERHAAETGLPVAQGEADWPADAEGPRVRFLGQRPSIDVPRIMAGADLFVLASRRLPDTVESFGIVYVEAAAAGLATVGTRVGGVASAVADGESGVLVPPDDPRALAEAMGQLLGDPEWRAQLGRQGRQRALQRFAAPVVVRPLFETLQGVAKRRRPG